MADLHGKSINVMQVMAGSDTAGISLCAIVYYVLETPRIQQRLHSELVSTGFSSPFSFKLLENLPYLAAVILEATRVHPGVGLPLERIVPPEGLGLSDGRYIPAGTIVGMNAWVVHQDKGVFGENRVFSSRNDGYRGLKRAWKPFSRGDPG